MSDYKVVIKGNKEDMDIKLVLNNLSILFKSDPEKLRPFLASKSFIAKRLSDYETAKKWHPSILPKSSEQFKFKAQAALRIP